MAVDSDVQKIRTDRPVAGGAVTFSQTILEVAPGGGSEKPEPQPEVEGFLFVMAGTLEVTHEGTAHTLTPGGFAFLPAGSTWSAKSVSCHSGACLFYATIQRAGDVVHLQTQSPTKAKAIHVGNQPDSSPDQGPV